MGSASSLAFINDGDVARRRENLPRQDMGAGFFLLGSVVAYGVAMFFLSGVTLRQFVPVLAVFGSAALAGLAAVFLVYAALCVWNRDHARGWANRLFWLAIAALLVALTFPFFGMFKQFVLPRRGFVWDTTFAHIGRFVLGGTSPWRLTHAWFGSLAGTRFLNLLYSLWLVIIFLFPMVAGAFVRAPRLRLRLLVSWWAAWLLIGTVGAWCLASAGPCYFNLLIGPDANYADLQMHLAQLRRQAAAEGSPIETLEFQPMLLQAFHARIFAPAGGISAAPSMHVALATLCAIAGLNLHRVAGLLLAAYALLIWIGSIHFGWHYFVDGPIAAVLMLVVWWVSGLIVPHRSAGAARSAESVAEVGGEFAFA